jgi:hypothetical protein
LRLTRPRLGPGADGRGLASDHRHVLGRIAFALDLDSRGCIRDCAQILPRKLDIGGADVLLEPVELGRAGDGNDRGPLGKQPRERNLSRGLALLVANPLQQIHERLVLLHRLRLEARDAFAEIALAQISDFAYCAGQETLAQRAVRDKTNPQLSPGRRQTSSNRTVSLISVRRGAMSPQGARIRVFTSATASFLRGDQHLAVAVLYD